MVSVASLLYFWNETTAMVLSEDELRDLLDNPRENLGVELKRWIDPNTDEGAAKIAKGCIALRNNNGGLLIIGFKDDGKPVWVQWWSRPAQCFGYRCQSTG